MPKLKNLIGKIMVRKFIKRLFAGHSSDELHLLYDSDGNVLLPFPSPFKGFFPATGLGDVCSYLRQQFMTAYSLPFSPANLDSLRGNTDIYNAKESTALSKVRLICLVVGHPANALMKEEIIPKAKYWHYRSGINVDLFCLGFPSNRMAFDEAVFNQAIRHLESVTTWRYSGETELILVNARYTNEEAVLDFSGVVVLRLEKALKEEAISSVGNFVERLVQFAEKSTGSDPAWGFSDWQGVTVAGDCLKKAVLSLLPDNVQKGAKKAANFVVQDISK